MSFIPTTFCPKSNMVESGLWNNVECEKVYPRSTMVGSGLWNNVECEKVYPRSTMVGSGLWKNVECEKVYPTTTTGCVDQFEIIDHAIARTLNTMARSQLMEPTMLPEINCMKPTFPCPPKKFRIVCEEVGFIPHTVKTCIKGNMLHVIGLVQCIIESGVYTQREFKRCYELPRYVCFDKMVTLFTEHGQLIIEMPLMEVDTYPESGRFGGLVLPTREQIQPENVYVTVNMIVKDEDKTYKPIHMGAQPTYYKYNRTFPETMESKYIFDEKHFTMNATPLGMDKTRFVDYKQYKNCGF